MNPVELVLKAEAAASGRVRPRRLLRHTHVEAAPLGIAALQMAGEPHALWAALVGSQPDRPRLIVAPEPRNRDIVFQALADFAEVVCGVVDQAAVERVELPRRSGESVSCCQSAPQLLVANRAVADLLGRLGRRMRTAGFGGHVSVPPSVNRAGAHLGFFAEATRQPGSALVLMATEALARQAATGQSDFEDAHLGAQLAWWDPAILERVQPGCLAGADPRTIHGAHAATRIERVPMSVLTDPRDDNGRLLDAVERFNVARAGATDRATVRRLGTELADLLSNVLWPQWRGLWEAHRLLLGLPAAPGAERRWEADRLQFTRHIDYLADGGHLANVQSARRAAMLLADWERAQAELERDEVLEDPLALASALAAGQAIEGEVTDIDLDHRAPGPSGKSLVVRPLVTLRSSDPCPFPLGAELWWTMRPGEVGVEIVSTTGLPHGRWQVVLKVHSGMRGALPTPGTRAVFSIYTTRWVPPAPLPRATPWTHVPEPDVIGDDGLELDDGPPLDTALALGGAR